LVFLVGATTASAWSTSPGAQDGLNGLEGVISSEHGEPLVGAIVSVFGANLADGALITISDEDGHFQISGLPPGPYTLRAYLSGFLPSSSSRVEVATGGSAAEPISMRLAPIETPQPSEPLAESAFSDGALPGTDERLVSELKWLLRHGKRNVLHGFEGPLLPVKLYGDTGTRAGPDPLDPLVGTSMTGEMGIMAASLEEEPADLSAVNLDARLAFARLEIPTGPGSRWEVSAQLLESLLSSWNGRAEFVTEGFSGQELAAGLSYGSYEFGVLDELRPSGTELVSRRRDSLSVEWFGSAFGRHRFRVGAAEVDAGLSYQYFSYLDRPGYLTPRLEVSWQPVEGGRTLLRGALDYRVMAPGGEGVGLLTRVAGADIIGPTIETSPKLQAEKTVSTELSVERRLGDAAAVEVLLFREEATDQLIKAYVRYEPLARKGPGHYLVSNGGAFRARGVGLGFSSRLGSVASSVGYKFGLARTLSSAGFGGFEPGSEEEIHDLTTALATEIGCTGTRLNAVYRLISHPSMLPEDEGAGSSALDSRFNVQVRQLLPSVGWSSAEWELILAVRNLFYQDLEAAAFLDELAVVDSPRRFLGGVTVRF
jgi:hypothetical protein